MEKKTKIGDRCLGLVLLTIVVFLSGCTTAQKGAGVGAVGAGALGAIIGHQSGHTAEGAAIGAGIGAVTGAIVGEQMETKFCPKCGRRYTSGKIYCPTDGTKLEMVEK